MNAQCNLAWVFAISPDASVRDRTRALTLAQSALQLSGGKDPRIFRLLAAAYAENGQFTEAIATAQWGLELAEGQDNLALANAIQTNIVLYRTSIPLREVSPGDH